MQDQVAKLVQFGVSATFLGSGQKDSGAAEGARQGRFSLVYVTPESARSFLTSMDSTMIGLVAIDESHCVSEWGHDFRPAYRGLAFIRELLPTVPIMALTASATPDVQTDVINQLKLNQINMFTARESFNRPNLFYEVRAKSDFAQDVIPLLNPKESNIIYVPTISEAESFALLLQKRGVKADFYTGDLDSSSRERVHEAFTNDKLNVVVATIAFGMGIDKPDVRKITHWGVTKTRMYLCHNAMLRYQFAETI
jgi:RecQ family ATP-dependent DNA helicase